MKQYDHSKHSKSEATDVDETLVKMKLRELLFEGNKFKNQSERIELLEKGMTKRELAFMINELVNLVNALDGSIGIKRKL